MKFSGLSRRASDVPRILLVNPWIYDFAAYDFWAKPMGLLLLAALLRRHGYAVHYIDCLDRFHPLAPPSDPGARCGRGPYLKTPLPPPQALADVSRRFCRYGIRPEWFRHDLRRTKKPDLILVTSMMTYWYPGVSAAIRVIRQVWPAVPIVLGGIYATLCPHHARQNCGADDLITGEGEAAVLRMAAAYTGAATASPIGDGDLDRLPYPAFDLQHCVNYVTLRTSVGCPYRCAYCASHILNPVRRRRSAEHVVEEILFWHTDFRVNDFVLYDDAFLLDAEAHAVPLLEQLVEKRLPVRFHTPNAVHIRGISGRIARLMHAAGFTTLRLGLETAAFEGSRTLDHKVTRQEFASAVRRLHAAGFTPAQIGAYLLAGLPGQPLEAVAEAAHRVWQSGVTPIPAYYSPIPGTRLWPTAKAHSRYDLEKDPIFTNNAILPCRKQAFDWQELSRLKNSLPRP